MLSHIFAATDKSQEEYRFQTDKLRSIRAVRATTDTDCLFQDEMDTLCALYQWRNSFLRAESRHFRMQVVLEAYCRAYGLGSEAYERAIQEHPELFDSAPMNEYTF